jgi:hypothetical protein
MKFTGRVVLTVAIGGLAVALRVAPISSGLPYIDYIDEGHTLHQTLTVLQTKSFRTRWYGYPTLPSYVIAAATELYSPFYYLYHRHSLWRDLAPGEHVVQGMAGSYDFIYPADVIVIGRLIVATFSIGIVVMTALLAPQLSASVSRMAMLLVSVCPALVSRASIVIVDTLATFFVVTTLFICEKIRRLIAHDQSCGRWAFAAGLTSGLAFASKYTAGTVFVAVIFYLLRIGGGKWRKIQLLGLAACGVAGGCVGGMPILVFEPRTVVEALWAQSNFYHSIRSYPGLWGQAISSSEMGMPLVFASLLGLVWMLRIPSTRPAVIGWLLFAAVSLAILLPYPFQPFRNLLPLVPLACISAALLAVQAGQYVAAWCRRAGLGLAIATGLLMIVAVPCAFTAVRQITQRMSHVDSRARATDWLQHHTRNGDTVLIVEELTILPSDLGRVPAQVEVMPWRNVAGVLETGRRFDYIIAAEFELRAGSDTDALLTYQRRWQEQLRRFRVRAEFGHVANPLATYVWHTNDQHIFVLAAAD